MDYVAEIETRVAGIPCIVGVTEYHRVEGSRHWNAASDLDYTGYTDCEWVVLDSRGRPAPWLARKLSDDDSRRIDDEIDQHFENANYDWDGYDA